MSFAGFPKEGVSWFQALSIAQNREWFAQNKAAFELLWLEPTKALLAEVKGPLEKIYKRKLGEPKVFRLNRDVRFSKDKSPYKRWMAGMLPFAGFKPMEGPAALYFHLGMEDEVAFGFYVLESPMVKKLRAGILDEKSGRELQKYVDAARKKGLRVESMEVLKRAPPGVDPAHPRVELLKHKALALGTDSIPKSVRYNAKFKDWVLDAASAAAPVLSWGFKRLV
jgi:uncharacterized protein (TIGR02453 family)